MKGLNESVATEHPAWIVLADKAGVVACSHPVAAEFEQMMQVVPGPVSPEIPHNDPVETPPQPPDVVPGDSPEEHPDSAPRENPDDSPQEVPEGRRSPG